MALRACAPPPSPPPQFQFLSFLFSGASGHSYKGRDLTSVHVELTARLGFSDAHFDLAKVMLHEIMEGMEMAEEVLYDVLDTIERTRFLLLPDSVYKPKDGADAGALTLLDRMGGPDTLKELIDLFYDKLVVHDRTKHFFLGMDMDDQRDRQVSVGRVAGVGWVP